MSLSDDLRGINDLDFNNLGSWPAAVRAIACGFVVLAVLVAGYFLHLQELQERLERVAAEEEQLQIDFASKAEKAANLEAYKEQMERLNIKFGALLQQLPSDTEVPGLLEDITRTGLASGLEFDEIKLMPEVAQQFYIELPIQITVAGTYHDFATFVSSVASQDRIVTMHDFEIRHPDDTELKSPIYSAGKMKMSILAKTYRYNDQGVQK